MNDLRKHQFIALFSFITLAAVLTYLTYNTFVLKDRQYQLREKELLKDFYREYVANDNIYPGGYDIVSKYVEVNICPLEELYKREGKLKSPYTDSLLHGLFAQLIRENPLDSTFKEIKHKYHLDEDLQYLLTVNSIKIRFNQGLIVPLFEDPGMGNVKNKPGYIIGGKLESPLPQNQVSSISLSSSLPYSYDISFSFYADTPDRKLHIFESALPILLLALLALSATVSIYYLTFRNWIKQKKLAEMKSDFINSITHEFNTPISTILVANKNLQNEKVTQNKQSISELTGIIDRQSLRLQKLFNQVLDITQMDKDLEKETADLSKLIKETVKDYEFKSIGQNVSILLSGFESPVLARLNSFWVTTMLLNIIENAVKYNDHEEKVVRITLATGPTEHFLRISDNGIGMESHTLKHIFDKFYREQSKSPGQVAGLGLGLYYSQQCLKLHGWKLTVDSQPGTGSEFTIIIPKHA